MSLFSFLWRKKPETEMARRARLCKYGRVTEGMILDTSDTGGDTPSIYFTYCVNGSDYEASHELDQQQRACMEKYGPGAPISIRYDPHQPANAVVV